MRFFSSAYVPPLRAALVAGVLGLVGCSSGSSGQQGPQGPQGPPGPASTVPGPSGATMLVATVAEPAGANCPNGGLQLQAGLDEDRSGTLEDKEVHAASTRYLCNGAAGAAGLTGPAGERGEQGPPGATGDSGFNTLVATTVEPAGTNCPNGGQKLQAGLDLNRNGSLDGAELSASTPQYLCNGAPGATGAKGDKGEPGALALYGDGSAGDLIIYSQDSPRYLNLGYYTLAKGANLMFRNIRVEGRLFVSSGTMLRATGDITIAQGGLLVVQPDLFGEGASSPPQGISTVAAVDSHGGRGLSTGRAAQLTRFDLEGGGGGNRPVSNANVEGGEGGGRLILAALGKVTIDGLIDAKGRNALNKNGAGAGIPGGGGGGGGVVTIVSRGALTLGANSNVWVDGGNGAPGVSGAAGVVVGGGGGGGGGIIHLISATNPTIATGATVTFAGGTAGASAGSGTGGYTSGGGGGASGGNGGNGARSTATADQSKDGSKGSLFTTIADQPELLVY